VRALYSIAAGGPSTLQLVDVPDPVAARGEIVVAVAACAINYPDVLVIEDKYQFKPQRPFAPGSEIAGRVYALGDGVEGFAIGDRVIAMLSGNGGLADRVVASADNVFHLPDERDFIEGSALLFTYSSAIHALKDRGRLKAGETLLVLGAGGGIGLATVEIGKAIGARVVGAVSSEEKAKAALVAGADDALIYGRPPFSSITGRALTDSFRAAVGAGGADVILDPVGGEYAEAALRAISWRGRYLTVGFPAGIPRLPLNLALLKGCDIRGVFQGSFAARETTANKDNIRQLFEWWRASKICPRVTEIFPLERGGEAIERLARRAAIGKLVVQIANLL
jgi:NADPH2:quinone reductase